MYLTLPLTGASGSSGNNAGGVTQNLPGGQTFQELEVLFGGTVAASNITSVMLNVAGQDLFSGIDGTFLDLRNQFDKLDAFATKKVLTLSQQMQLLDLSQAVKTLLTIPQKSDPKSAGGVLTFKVEGATNPTYIPQGSFLPTPPELQSGPNFVTRLAYNKKGGLSDGQNDFLNLPFGDALHYLLRRIFLKPDAGTIDKVQLLNSVGAPIWERTADQNTDALTKYGQRDPSVWSGFVFDTTERGFADMLDTSTFSALTLRMFTTGAASVEIWSENIGNLLPG